MDIDSLHISKLERFTKKKQVPQNDQVLFILYLKSYLLNLTRRVPATTSVVELMKKTYFAIKTD